MELGLFAPHDPELNPEGEIKKKVPPKTLLQVGRKRSQQDMAPTKDSLQMVPSEKTKAKRQKTRWDTGPRSFVKLPGHWREMTQVGGRPDPSPEEKLWREMVQKIIFADAVCGTSTPTEALHLLLHF